MTQHTERFGDGFVTYSTVDAEFQFEGKLTYMEVHHYCGPSFYTLDKNECEQWIYPDDDPKWNPLWKEYEDWVLRTTGVAAPSHQN